MKLYYYYQTRCNPMIHIPAVFHHEGSRKSAMFALRKAFKGSVTPLASILKPFSTRDDLENILDIFRAHSMYVEDQKGLYASLRQVIGSLEEDYDNWGQYVV